MSLNNKKVFLAGATGMVGSAITNHLLDKYPDTKIRAVYYKNTKPFIIDDRIEYVYGNLSSQEDCRKLVEGCDCAFMAAANTGGSGVFSFQPWEQINDNLTMNAQMLEAFHLEQLERVVYIGSATLYQENSESIKEDELDLNLDPNPAHMGIGWVSRYLEKLCKFWHDQTGMEIVIVRAANIFGPYAKFDPLRSNFIPAIIRKAVEGLDPFEVWGSPDVTRDVIYSDDFAKAIVSMMDNRAIKFDVFNLGSGVATTVDDVVTWTLKYAGHSPSSIKYNSDKPTTINYRVIDCSKAKEKLNWQPENTVEDGIRKTTEWWIENKERWKK